MSRAAGGGGSGPAVLNNGFQQPDFNGVVRREGRAAPALFSSLLAGSSEQRAAGTGEGRQAAAVEEVVTVFTVLCRSLLSKAGGLQG